MWFNIFRHFGCETQCSVSRSYLTAKETKEAGSGNYSVQKYIKVSKSGIFFVLVLYVITLVIL